MKIIQREPKSYISEIESYKTTYIWAIDGWVYDIVKKIRKQFFIQDGEITMETEPYTQSIPTPMYIEALEIKLLSKVPLVWKEVGVNFEETYEEVP
jgi:hypothetical protein